MAEGKILERLRKARTELNQKELAEKLGMSLSTYLRMIDGASPLTLDTIRKLSQIFNVSEDVVTGKVPMFEELPRVAEPEAVYRSPGDTLITVNLDGTKATLDLWIKKLSAINQVI